LDAVAGADEIIRFGPLAIDPYTVFAKDFSNVTDGKVLCKKFRKFLGRFTRGRNDFMHVAYQIMAEVATSQAGALSIFAILQALR
jgi:hypothetical protein